MRMVVRDKDVPTAIDLFLLCDAPTAKVIVRTRVCRHSQVASYDTNTDKKKAGQNNSNNPWFFISNFLPRPWWLVASAAPFSFCLAAADVEQLPAGLPSVEDEISSGNCRRRNSVQLTVISHQL